uniref:Bifunctional inhibitor/plant lipid transfer protein/seed storage helical domain-containing protein n=1 Tax=Oryza meridionalis TaxID=40149 RepID=A0A0E0E1S2_9ORYZ
MTSPVNLPHHHHLRCRLHAAAALLHLMVLLGGGAEMARAQAIPTSCCGMFDGLDLAPCLQDAVAGAGAGIGIAGGNISGACCSSLNQALDASHRCLCSLLLPSNGGGAGVSVLASLAAALPALPLALPLPGCLLYAPPVLSCQVPVQEQTDAPPAATEAATATETTVDSPPPQAVVMPPSKKSKRSADGENADDDQGMNRSYSNGDGYGNGNGGAKKKTASRSEARRRTNVDEGVRTHLLTFVVVMAAFWFSII